MTRIRDVLALATFAALLAVLSGGAQAADQDQDKPIIKAKPKPVVDTPLFTYIDDRLTYAYIYHTTDAGAFVPKAGGGYKGSIDQNVVAFTHFDSWAYGTNFLNIGIYKSAGPIDAAAPCTSPGLITDSGGTVAANCPGESDIYGLIRSTFGFNQIFDTKAFTWGPLHNVSLEVGADVDTSNSYLASQDNKG